MVDEETVEALRRSKMRFRAFYPVLKAPDGTIIDGCHRLKADPNWFSVVLKDADTQEKVALAKLIVNTARRTVTAEEITEGLSALAKVGLTVEQMAEELGRSERWVRKYMPQEMKDQTKVEAGAVGGMVSAAHMQEAVEVETVKTQDSGERRSPEPQDLRKPTAEEPPKPQLVECERCHINTSIPQDWRGHQLCDKCHENAELNPEAYEGFFRYLKKQVAEKPPVEVHKYKPKETWEHRKATMTPGVSKMDEAVLLALQQSEILRSAGWKFEFQKRYCIKEVRSDVTATRGDVEKPLFLDGEVHVGKEERDEANRELLARRLKIPEVLAFSYEGAYSDVKRDEIVAKIVETLK